VWKIGRVLEICNCQPAKMTEGVGRLATNHSKVKFIAQFHSFCKFDCKSFVFANNEALCLIENAYRILNMYN